MRSLNRPLWRVVRRMGVALGLVAALAAAPRASAAICTGDCNGDTEVTVSELIVAVNIALGASDLSLCRAIDGDADGDVDISDLVAAVVGALGECRPATVTVTGSCLRPGPGPSGLIACSPGTVVRVFRCDARATCLDDAASLPIGMTAVGGGGMWGVVLDREAASDTALVFEASVDAATVYRILDFGPVGARASSAGAAGLHDLSLSPSSEAAVRLLDQMGLENFSDQGILDVVEAVGQATAGLSFEALDPAEAAAQAGDVAAQDPTVGQVIAQALHTPTPTASGTRTPTPTITPTPTRTATLPPPIGIAYVANGNGSQVTLIDTETDALIGSVPVGDGPTGVAATPDGALLLVTNRFSDTVSILDTATRMPRGVVPDFRPAVIDEPFVVASGDSVIAYVSQRSAGLVDVVDLGPVRAGGAEAELLASLPTGAGAFGIAVARAAGFALVANNGDRTLSVIDTGMREIVRSHMLSVRPALIALTSDDALAYVTTQNAENEPVSQTVLAIDTARLRAGTDPVVNTFTVGNNPTGVVVAPDDRYVYVINSGSSTLSVIARSPDDPAGTLVGNVPLLAGQRPVTAALTRDGRLLYVTNCFGNSVSIVDAELALSAPQTALLRTLAGVGPCPQGIAVVEP